MKWIKFNKKTVLAASIGGAISSFANAQIIPNSSLSAALSAAEQDQRTRQQQESRERAAAINAPAVRGEAIARAEYPTLPQEAPCFRITQFKLEVPKDLPPAMQAIGASSLPMDPFAFAQQWLSHYAGECIGKQGVETLVKGLSQTILSKGYVTTRVLIPTQDLSSGTLILSLIPGVIGDIRFSDPELWGTWKSAFPTAPGELLNLRDLEQGLEQMTSAE